jgi:hypothetical protein
MLSCVVAAVLAFWRARENDVVFGPSVWLGANCKFGYNLSHEERSTNSTFVLANLLDVAVAMGRLVPS